MRAVEGAGEQVRLVGGMVVFYLAKLDGSRTRYGLDTGNASDNRKDEASHERHGSRKASGPGPNALTPGICASRSSLAAFLIISLLHGSLWTLAGLLEPVEEIAAALEVELRLVGEMEGRPTLGCSPGRCTPGSWGAGLPPP